jgi:hypothetical protein
MIRTNRQAISEVLNDLRVLNPDEYLSKQYIYSKLVGYTDFLVKRDSDNRRIFNHRYLFKPIECVNLEPVDISCCEDFELEIDLKRTAFKLPSTLSTIFGPILNVFPVIGFKGYKFVETTSRAYQQILKRAYQDPSIIYYWYSDSYLYFPNSPVDSVKIEAPFNDFKSYNDIVNKTNDCYSILDSDFICPDYLFEDVKKMAIAEISTLFQRPIDELNDLNTNIKSNK